MNRPFKNSRPIAWSVWLVLLAVLILPGCSSVGPDYVQPDIKLPPAYTSQSEEAGLSETDRQALAQWWTLFNDPLLTKLIDRSLDGNLNLKEAKAKLRQVRWQRRVADLKLWPTGSVTGSAGRKFTSDDDFNWNHGDSFGVSLDVSWETDLFGGNRRQAESALAEYQAAREDLRDVLVSLTAESATAYVRFRTYQLRLQMAQDSLKLQEETLELTKVKYQSGLAGDLDVQQASYSLESTRSQIPGLRSGLEEQKNRLSVLLGGWPGDLNQELESAGTIPSGPLKVAVGVPANLLRRRPDVRAAERRLAARTADIGAAEGELYPKLTLSGSVGVEALKLGDLFSPGSLLAALLSSIKWAIFDLDTVRANIEIQNALQEQALISYESTLRTAVEEVENALTALVQEAHKQESLAKALKSAESATRLALQGYESGISDFQKVLDTQQALISFKDSLAQSRGQASLNLIVAYKALGGGWTHEGLEASDTAPQKQPEAKGPSQRLVKSAE